MEKKKLELVLQIHFLMKKNAKARLVSQTSIHLAVSGIKRMLEEEPPFLHLSPPVSLFFVLFSKHKNSARIKNGAHDTAPVLCHFLITSLFLLQTGTAEFCGLLATHI